MKCAHKFYLVYYYLGRVTLSFIWEAGPLNLWCSCKLKIYLWFFNKKDAKYFTAIFLQNIPACLCSAQNFIFSGGNLVFLKHLASEYMLLGCLVCNQLYYPGSFLQAVYVLSCLSARPGKLETLLFWKLTKISRVSEVYLFL